MGHSLSVQTQTGTAARRRHQITREALLLFLLETANYEPKDFLKRLEALLSRLDRKALYVIEAHIHDRLEH